MTSVGGSEQPHISVERASSKPKSGRLSSLKSWLPPIAALVVILGGTIAGMGWIYYRWIKMETIVAPLQKACYRQGPVHIGGKFFPEQAALEYLCVNYGPDNVSRNYTLKVLVPNELDPETKRPQNLRIHELGEVHISFEGLEEKTLCTICLKENIESLGAEVSFGASFFSVQENWLAKDYYLLDPSHRRVNALASPPSVQMKGPEILWPINILLVLSAVASATFSLLYMRNMAKQRVRRLENAEAVRRALEEQLVAQAKMAMKMDLLRRLEPPPPWRKKREE